MGAETKAAKVLGELPKDTNRTRAKYRDSVDANNGFMKNKSSIDVLKKQIRDTQPKNKQDVQ